MYFLLIVAWIKLVGGSGFTPIALLDEVKAPGFGQPFVLMRFISSL